MMVKEVEVKVEQVDQVDGLWILHLKQSGKMQPSTSTKKEEKKQFSNIGWLAWRKKSALHLTTIDFEFNSYQSRTPILIHLKIFWWSTLDFTSNYFRFHSNLDSHICESWNDRSVNLVKLLMDSLSLFSKKNFYPCHSDSCPFWIGLLHLKSIWITRMLIFH